MSARPYKVVAREPGAADVHDRTTGEWVGFVLEDYYGFWQPYVVVKGEGRRIASPLRYRKDAALVVWVSTEEDARARARKPLITGSHPATPGAANVSLVDEMTDEDRRILGGSF